MPFLRAPNKKCILAQTKSILQIPKILANFKVQENLMLDLGMTFIRIDPKLSDTTDNFQSIRNENLFLVKNFQTSVSFSRKLKKGNSSLENSKH